MRKKWFRWGRRNQPPASSQSDGDVGATGNVGVSLGNSRKPQKQLTNNPQFRQELLSQEKADIEQLGSPLLKPLIACLGKRLPCSVALIERMLWVMVWGWKLFPLALYESFKPNFITNAETGETVERGGFHQYVSKWWQKSVLVPAAFGFYYFLYEQVAQPLVYSVGCCYSDFFTFLAEMIVLVLHFFSGLTIHFCQERNRIKRELQEQQDEEERLRHLEQQLQEQSPDSSLI
jgi:hypothetical protein